MTPVFSHGRLRLYLLKLLDAGPKHGYELIRLLKERFLGLYTPSAGTVYPRLARMESEGLVVHTVAGGRKVYEITEAGRTELRGRAGELDALEAEIRAAIEELAAQAGPTRTGARRPGGEAGPDSPAEAAAELERQLDAFAAELRDLVRDTRASERQLRAATTTLRGTLTALRELLG